MYPEVKAWLHGLLSQRVKGAKVYTYDTSKAVLSKFLFDNKIHTYFQGYQTFEIQVDVTGVMVSQTAAELVFVECKLNPISLIDVSQLLGYSKVANPWTSIIVSPKGISDSINLLFNVYQRYDVLEYDKQGRKVQIATWLQTRKDVDQSTIIPKGSSL
jgi:hypothetical protein